MRHDLPPLRFKKYEENIEITLQDEASGFIIFVSSRVKLRNARKTCLSLAGHVVFFPHPRRDATMGQPVGQGTSRSGRHDDLTRCAFKVAQIGDIFRKYVLRLDDVLKSFLRICNSFHTFRP